MALATVGARTEGDNFQGLFFWKQAADLLRPDSLVERVVLEHDDAVGVDDVAVFYREPGINAGGSQARADYFQVIYHVDRRDGYSDDALIDPSFINAKISLLQRFYKAYIQLSKQEHVPFRLNFASNWRWKDDDKLACHLRESDGALPRGFFEKGPRSNLGIIREKWRSHLGLDGATFDLFARTLRIKLDYFGRNDFKSYVYLTLQNAGLRTPSADRAACPYESLVQKFLMNGPHSFDPDSFLELCERERLLMPANRELVRPFAIGVRSIMRFAERLESEVDQLVCVSSNFEGRSLAQGGSWEASAAGLLEFLSDKERRARLRAEESVIALECHGSFALLAGWELSRNTGVMAAPLQKPTRQIWRPTDNSAAGPTWVSSLPVEINADAEDVAICLSVTHDARADVETYLSSTEAPPVRHLVILSPENGPSPQCIMGADHAYQLATAIPELFRRARPTRTTMVHLFFACPNALLFFIGQQRDALGRCTLYEFDFGMDRDGSYQHSFSLPPTANTVAAH